MNRTQPQVAVWFFPTQSDSVPVFFRLREPDLQTLWRRAASTFKLLWLLLLPVMLRRSSLCRNKDSDKQQRMPLHSMKLNMFSYITRIAVHSLKLNTILIKPKRYQRHVRHKKQDLKGDNRAMRQFCPRYYNNSNTPLQNITSPNSFAKCFTFTEDRALVNTSATMLSVGQ